MGSINFKSLPADYQELVSALRQHIANSEKYLVDFEHRQYNGTREKAVVYCLRHAIDLAKGCLAISEAGLPDSTATLSRATLEALFWARYVTMSPENAQEFTNSTINEMKRVARKNLSAGYAQVFDINTNNDKTNEFLNSSEMKDIPGRLSIETAAKLGGLERVYTNLYGFLSMIAHGRAYDLRTKAINIKGELFSSVSATLGALECIEVISSDWIAYRKQTPREIIIRLLGA
jgi:hypothetical protein